MTDLITRLEEAAEGSRELDLRVFEHFDRVNGERWTEADLDYALTDPDKTINPPHLTTSLDAALALAKRVLPEMNCIGFDKSPRGVEAYVSRNHVKSGHWVVVGEHRSSPALALCIAIYRAMLAASPQGEGSSADATPIKPSSDTGELRGEVIAAVVANVHVSDGRTFINGPAIADAILDLIQSERAG